MLAMTEPGVEIITAMVSTQLLKTALLENIVGYHAHIDPCPILLVQPKEDAAEAFSKERIAPMIRVTPVLNGLIGHRHTRKSEDTLLYKSFPGGFVALVGAGSPDNLARRPVRLTLYDEVDKYPITKEGDPFVLGDERQATFSNGLSVRVCSPTVSGESRIEASYLDGDQRRASAACPHCDHRQFLSWDHIRWDKDEAEGHEKVHRHETAQIFCEACGAGWSEGERLRALQTILWHQTRPFICCGERQVPLEAYAALTNANAAVPVDDLWEWWASDRWGVYRAKCRCCGTLAVPNAHASFQASKLFSPWTRKDAPGRIAKKFLDAIGDEDKLQAWQNTQMGLPYRRNVGKAVAADVLAARRESWIEGTVPDGVAVLTAGIDTQDDRFEVEIVGWGKDLESWSIDYRVIDGAMEDPATWARLDAFLKQSWRRADGRAFTLAAACHDSGGHHSQKVYDFSLCRLGRNIWATKGASERAGQRSPIWPNKRPSAKHRQKYRPIIIGTQTAKDVIQSQLQVVKPEGWAGEPVPGLMHTPNDRDIGWFSMMTAERQVVKVASGQKYRVWEAIPGRANEAWDCRVLAYAALVGLTHLGLKLNQIAATIANLTTSEPDETGGQPVAAPLPPEAKPAQSRRRVQRSSYMGA